MSQILGWPVSEVTVLLLIKKSSARDYVQVVDNTRFDGAEGQSVIANLGSSATNRHCRHNSCT